MISTARPCERCGHRPVKSFTQRLGETILVCAFLGAVVLILTLAAGAGA